MLIYILGLSAVILFSLFAIWMCFFLTRACWNSGPRHKYAARYSEERVPPTVSAQYDAQALALVTFGAEAFTQYKKTYIGDVCVHCGKTVAPGK